MPMTNKFAGRSKTSQFKYNSQLAQNAVHGAMAGWTAYTVGTVNNRTCYIPLNEITHPEHPVNIQPDDRAWQRLLASTGQPSFINDEDDIVKTM